MITETWLDETVTDALVSLDGFTLVRSDRTADSAKSRAGGIAVYIKDKWCSQFTVRESLCNKDIELLCLSMRPFYLPREFGNIVLCAVYIPPDGNAARAATAVADCVHRQLKRTPEAPCFVLGDVNHCKLDTVLPGFQQYVDCKTRGKNVLDKCYGNVKDAFVAEAKPPLSSSKPPFNMSDHNVVHLIPTYRSLLKRSKPQVKTIHVWNNDGIETLKGCFCCTDWSLFHSLDLEEATDTMTEYIKFCKDNVLTKKTITMYPNNKPYISSEIKELIVKKQRAFKSGDLVTMRNIHKEMNQKIGEAKRKEKEKFEAYCATSNSKKMWESMKAMTNMAPAKKGLCVSNEKEKANELNNFYARFESTDFLQEQKIALESVPTDSDLRIILDQDDVQRTFAHTCPRKASGPDGICGRLLHSCSQELAEAWCPIYQKSLDTHTVPSVWKDSVIIPVPKKACCKENNDYRPVALTSVIMKCFEKIIISYLKAAVGCSLDTFQFAYISNRGIEDAVLALDYFLLKHLENSKAYARLLLVDFSSAFNTIQSHLLISRLRDLNVHPLIIRWYYSFLTERTQRVSVNGPHQILEIHTWRRLCNPTLLGQVTSCP